MIVSTCCSCELYKLYWNHQRRVFSAYLNGKLAHLPPFWIWLRKSRRCSNLKPDSVGVRISRIKGFFLLFPGYTFKANCLLKGIKNSLFNHWIDHKFHNSRGGILYIHSVWDLSLGREGRRFKGGVCKIKYTQSYHKIFLQCSFNRRRKLYKNIIKLSH